MVISGNIKLSAALSVAVLCLSVFCAASEAQLTNDDLPNRDGIKAGETIVHAAFKTEEQLDTNIFLADSDTKFDAITVLSPSVGIELPLRESSISADYQADIFLYGNYHDQNHVDQHLRGLAEINLSHYKITAEDDFRIFTSRAADENSIRLQRKINNGRIGVAAQFKLLGFDAGYTNRLETYDSDNVVYQSVTYEDKDRVSNIIDATVSYRFLPKTLVMVENDLGLIHYYNSSLPPDSYYDEALVGIKGEWFSRMNVNFKVGFRYQDYDNSDIMADKAYIGAVMRGGCDYHPTGDDVIVLDLVKTVYESTYSNMNYYDAALAGLTYRHNFNDKLSASLFGNYQLHLYPSQTTENGVAAKRHDNFMQGGASLRYDVRKWLSAEVRYEYRQRISKFDVFDYIDNVVTIRGTVGF